MNTAGGAADSRIAATRLLVACSRLSRIRCFCAAAHRLPAIDSPARLTTAPAPPSVEAQAPLEPFGVQATRETLPSLPPLDPRVSTTTSWPSRASSDTSG